jgi:hypothetical protein
VRHFVGNASKSELERLDREQRLTGGWFPFTSSASRQDVPNDESDHDDCSSNGDDGDVGGREDHRGTISRRFPDRTPLDPAPWTAPVFRNDA